MTILADFLKEQAEQERAKAPERARKLHEWQVAVEQLLRQMETWLREADHEHILVIRWTQREMREAGLGAYLTPVLVIELNGRRLQVEPGGRNTFGEVTRQDTGQSASIQGCVNILDGGYKHTLYRIPGAGDSEWFLVDRYDYQARPLDRKEFERMMVSLLQ